MGQRQRIKRIKSVRGAFLVDWPCFAQMTRAGSRRVETWAFQVRSMWRFRICIIPQLSAYSTITIGFQAVSIMYKCMDKVTYAIRRLSKSVKICQLASLQKPVPPICEYPLSLLVVCFVSTDLKHSDPFISTGIALTLVMTITRDMRIDEK